MRKIDEERRSTATQLRHKEDVPDNVANASHCIADMRGEESLPDDSSSVLSTVNSDKQGSYDAVADASSQSLTSEFQGPDVSFFTPSSSVTTTSSFGQRNFDHHESAGRNDSQASQSTTVPTFTLWPPETPAIVTCHLKENFVVPPQVSIHTADQPATMEIAKPPHRPRDRSGSLPATQQHKVTPNEAQKALLDVIGYCMRQPPGFLELEEGVLLGKLLQKLKTLLAVDG